MGTEVSIDTPLMSAGLDSIGITDFATSLGKNLNSRLPPTLLFDHPSVQSILKAITGREALLEAVSGSTTMKNQKPHSEGSASSEIIVRELYTILGTVVEIDERLMATGLDSIAAAELSNVLT